MSRVNEIKGSRLNLGRSDCITCVSCNCKRLDSRQRNIRNFDINVRWVRKFFLQWQWTILTTSDKIKFFLVFPDYNWVWAKKALETRNERCKLLTSGFRQTSLKWKKYSCLEQDSNPRLPASWLFADLLTSVKLPNVVTRLCSGYHARLVLRGGAGSNPAQDTTFSFISETCVESHW